MRALRSRGVPYVSVNLEPVFGPIDGCVPLIEQAVRRAQAPDQDLSPWKYAAEQE
jgi:hypothetical protein